MGKVIILFVVVLFGLVAFFYSPPETYEIINPNPTGKTIVCFGDSLTHGTGAPKGLDYPTQLSKLIGSEVINEGVPGDTTATALIRIQKIIRMAPRIVLITLGGNDLKNGIKKEIAFDNLEKIVRLFQDAGALVVIGGLDFPLYGRSFSKQYEKLAKITGSVLVQDIFKDILGNPERMSDTIHPNAEGYTIMANHFYQALKPYL